MKDLSMNEILGQTERHLTNEQFDALLLSPAAGDASHPHLASCELCTEQLATLRSALGNLRTTSVVAADRHYRAAVQARRSQQRTVARPRLTWAFTAVAGLLFIGLPFAAKFRPVRIPNQPAVVADATKGPVVGPSANNISDDQLLSNIQSDLSASVPDPLLPLDNTSTDNSTKETK